MLGDLKNHAIRWKRRKRSLLRISLQRFPHAGPTDHGITTLPHATEFLSATMIGMKTVISELQSDTIAIQRTGKPRNVRGEIIFLLCPSRAKDFYSRLKRQKLKKYFAIHKSSFAKQCDITLGAGNLSFKIYSLQLMCKALVNKKKNSKFMLK